MDAHPWHDTVMRKFAKTADVPSDLLPGKLCGLGLRTLGAVLGTTLAAILHTGGIQSTTDDVVTDTGKVFYTAAANHDDGVFLKVVAFTGDVRGDFEAVGETLRRAEFAFFGVVVYTRVHTPRRWGQACRAGVFLCFTTFFRATRISWLIVGICFPP